MSECGVEDDDCISHRDSQCRYRNLRSPRAGKQRYWIVGVQTMFRQSFGQAFEMHDQFAVRKRWRAGRKQRGRVGPTFGHLP